MNPNAPRFEHILRSRSRSFGFPSASQAEGSLEKSKHRTGPSRQLFASSCRLSDIYKILLLFLILLAFIFILLWPETSIVLRTVDRLVTTTPSARPEAERTVLAPIHSFPADSPSTPRKMPLVDRSILQRLADMEISPDPDERPYFASSPQRPPMVTRIPEARKPLGSPHLPDICGSKPCRFLLPLRIGEQESKARIHFMEILQLAQRLDRILVLPNVGKSRIGACFKWDFEMYYDLERLTDDLALPAGQATVKLDLFRRWVDAEAPSAQLGFLSTKQESQLEVDPTTFSSEDVSIRVGSIDSNMDLPGCFAKFHALRLDAHAPLYIHLKPHAQGRSVGTSIVDALTRPDIQATATSPSSSSTDPAVLVLTWDLRYPIFP
ncbi:hypothetical protein B0H13DRAFT_2208897, partial [Mycena leptocephala]